jgi:hypothetical protein
MLTEVLLKSQSEGERSSHSERERNERTTRGGKGKVLGWLLWKWWRAAAMEGMSEDHGVLEEVEERRRVTIALLWREGRCLRSGPLLSPLSLPQRSPTHS